MDLKAGKKVFFVSDIHLGTPDFKSSREREIKLVQWFEHHETQAAAFYILGDLFDFWFEYSEVVPKGYVRILGKLADLRDKGIPVYFFTGNHDLWMFGYFEKELDIPVYKAPQRLEINNKKFLIGHGDGLGPEDHGFKRMKKIFTHPYCQKLFSFLHPDIGIKIANFWSRRSRLSNGEIPLETFNGKENEWLYCYADKKLEEEYFDYFIFGHRHLPLDLKVKNKSQYINLGDWLNYYSYAEFDGENLTLKYYTADSAISERTARQHIKI
ncbi:MAG: UDP-2,3-diacylglucosamine diphosphatase [Chitinophagales bacterium]